MSSSKFQLDRFKTQLKLSISRLVFLQKKLTGQSLAARKEIADLLRANKSDQAITKVRYIVRDDFLVEAMEFVQSFCDDLFKSANLIANSKSCDEFITEQAKSIIYASYRIDVPELAKVRDQLIFKFGQQIVPDQEVGVYPRLVLKLSMSNPDRYFCEQYIEAIAASFGIDWEGNSSIGSESSSLPDLLDSSNEKEELFPHPSDPRPHIPASLSSHSHTSSLKNSASSEVDPEKSAVDHLSPPPYNALSKGSSAPLPMDYSKQQPARPVITTTAPVITPATTAVKTPKPPTTTTSSNIPDFDELTRRFEALRKK